MVLPRTRTKLQEKHLNFSELLISLASGHPVRRIEICDNCCGIGIGWCRCGRASRISCGPWRRTKASDGRKSCGAKQGAQLLQLLYSVRSERLLMEEMD
jgi:hypothetical protein